ncbi:MAG: hypothetical protein PHG35_04525 [Dehalococcoidales bacterium]|nr:hypothetical protein [Dehalococcoidales bacterium]
MSKYTHLEPNKDVPTPSGYYVPHKEVRLPYDGREILYVLSEAVVDSSCCGTGDFNTALIPGYIVKWRGEKNEDGNSVSLVESITDEKTRDVIRKIIKEKENITQTEFW